MAIFETIYSWFHSFYNDTMWDTVKVIINVEEEKQLFADSLFIVGIITLVVSGLVAWAYYVWPINHPRFNAWKSWLLMLVVAALLNFGIGMGCGYFRVQSVNGSEEACAIIIGDEDEDEVSDLTDKITFSDYMGYGLSNSFVGSLFFILWCIPLTFYNGNARFSPFRL